MLDDADKELWRVGCEVARVAPNTGMVVLHSRTVLAVQGEIDRLREALNRAALALENQQDTIACWGAYASPFFQEKHDLGGDIESARVAAVSARNALRA